MQVTRQYPCKRIQFFNLIAKKIKEDLSIEAYRKVEVADLKEGMSYEKRIRVGESFNEKVLTTIVVYRKPEEIQLDIKMEDGVNKMCWKIKEVNENQCEVIYSEDFTATKLMKKVQMAIINPLFSKKPKKKMQELMDSYGVEIEKIF